MEHITKKENLMRMISHRDPQWVPLRNDGAITLLHPKINTRPPLEGADDWGTMWVSTGKVGGSMPADKAPYTIDQVQNIAVPNTDFGQVTEELKEQIQKHSDPDTLFVARNELFLFDRAKLLLGDCEFYMSLLCDSKSIETLLDKILDYQIRLTEAMMKSGVSGARFTDDWGAQETMLVNPDIWRQLIKPRLKIIYAIVKKFNGLIFQHSCGHIDEIVPDLIELGVNILDPCQPSAMNMYRLKDLYGSRICYMGGLDTQSYLTFADPWLIKQKVKEVLTYMSDGGGYIAAPSHSIELPKNNELAIIEAVFEFNQELKGKFNGKQFDSSQKN